MSMGRRTGNFYRSSFYTSLSVSLTKRASLASGSDGGSREISNFFPRTELVHPHSTPFATQTFVNNVYCLCQSESNLSFPIQPFPLLYLLHLFPCRYPPPPISPHHRRP